LRRIRKGIEMVMLLTCKDLRTYGIRYHRNHLDRLIKADKFPRPFKLTPGGWNYWTEDQIVEFVRSRAERDRVAA
jgi:hypothetical protein